MHTRMVVVLLLGILLAGCGKTLTDAEYIQQAEELLDAGQVQGAAVALKNALRANPANPRARYLLGQANLTIGNYAAAAKELQRALELGVGGDSVVPALAMALYGSRDYEALANLSNKGLQTTSAKA